MSDPQETITRIKNTFNTASDYFDHPALSFWNRFGQNTVNYLALKTGDQVLDVACGSGASAIPAALAVGSTGKVIGVDMADSLLRLARHKAIQNNLENTEFRCADLTNLGFPDANFDAIICVFGIFFIADMEATVLELWRMLRPGGKLAITSWGNRVFEPANTFFKGSVRLVQPNLIQTTAPWERIKTPESLKGLLESVDASNIEIHNEASVHKLTTPEDWWTILMGGGYRGVIEQLDPEVKENIKAKNITYLRSDNLQELDVDVLYAIAQKPN